MGFKLYFSLWLILVIRGILTWDFLSLDLHLVAVDRVPLNQKYVIMGVTFGRDAPVDGGKASVDAAEEGAISPIIIPPT